MMEGMFSGRNISVWVLLLCSIFPMFIAAALNNTCRRNCSRTSTSSVCASNGVTYPDKCIFEQIRCDNDADWVIIYESPCPNDCQLNCTNENTSKVCSSNVQTFNSLCEFKKQKCLQRANWVVIYNKECTTVPPPKKRLCYSHQEHIWYMERLEYDTKCPRRVLKEKSQNGTLKYSDIENCFEPWCENHIHYESIQCDVHITHWCWCVKPDGTYIPGSFKKDLEKKDCDNRKRCTANNGVMYDNGDVVNVNNTCGKCKCINGNITCELKYNITSRSEQINMFKNDSIQMFYNQQYYPEEVADIFVTEEHPYDISSEEKREIVRTKFHQYDRDNSRAISQTERHWFEIDLFVFVRCLEFYPDIFQIMDTTKDKFINLAEWEQFFGVEEDLSRKRRSLSNKKAGHKHRRKFKYILV